MRNDNILEFPTSRRKFLISIQREIEIMSIALGIDSDETSDVANTVEKNALKNFLKYESVLYSGLPKMQNSEHQELVQNIYAEEYLIKLDLIFEIIETKMKLDCRYLYNPPIQ